jgi:hypothetical protein
MANKCAQIFWLFAQEDFSRNEKYLMVLLLPVEKPIVYEYFLRDIIKRNIKLGLLSIV